MTANNSNSVKLNKIIFSKILDNGYIVEIDEVSDGMYVFRLVGDGCIKVSCFVRMEFPRECSVHCLRSEDPSKSSITNILPFRELFNYLNIDVIYYCRGLNGKIRTITL